MSIVGGTEMTASLPRFSILAGGESANARICKLFGNFAAMPASVPSFNYSLKISRPGFASTAKRRASIQPRLHNELIRLVVGN